MHYPNANHWHPEKREPGHSIHASYDNHPAIAFYFKPLILMDQAYLNAMG